MRILLLASLALLPAPILANTAVEPAAPEVVATPIALPAQPALCPAPSAKAVWDFSDSGIEAECTAYCWNGSTVTCSGPSCSAVDSACYGQRGYCSSSSGGTVRCPVCICPEPSCASLEGTYCKYNGTSKTCYEAVTNCRAFSCGCIENQYLCP